MWVWVRCACVWRTVRGCVVCGVRAVRCVACGLCGCGCVHGACGRGRACARVLVWVCVWVRVWVLVFMYFNILHFWFLVFIQRCDPAVGPDSWFEG